MLLGQLIFSCLDSGYIILCLERGWCLLCSSFARFLSFRGVRSSRTVLLLVDWSQHIFQVNCKESVYQHHQTIMTLWGFLYTSTTKQLWRWLRWCLIASFYKMFYANSRPHIKFLYAYMCFQLCLHLALFISVLLQMRKVVPLQRCSIFYHQFVL